MSRSSLRVAFAWALVAACIGLILSLSGDAFSARGTSRVITPLLRWLFPEMSGRELWQAHTNVRRAAHVFEYALLGVLAFRALRLSLDLSAFRVALLTLLVVFSVAGIDELRQSTSAARSGALGDVALDITGGAVGVLLIVAFHRLLGIGPPARGEP